MENGIACGCQDGRPTVSVQAACGGGGYQPTSFVGECAIDTELHVVGQYTAAENQIGDVQVTRLAHPMVIVLSSYDSTQWRVRLDPGVRVNQIILNGYEPSNLVDPPVGVEVVNRTGVGQYFSACAYTWPADDQGCDTPALVQGAEQATGLQLTTFQGCYSGAGFIISERMQP